ncbi:hypothetical protein O181_112691 [Austropuccinia psidii MF-1]|uniref:Reverse transcriptase domain-containing protein n=1 Tax=Austropuccinia psidii MF-1 TaxID=1389203 RepID=A0A9Q3PTS4_9BASI|nr:hypothetical protein [Austropuccinia psidii MF-1]
MSELPENIPLFILDSNELTSLFITHYTKWVVELPLFPRFEWDFLIIDSPKGQDLTLGYDFLYHFNPTINWKNGLITYDSSHKDSSGIISSASNDFATAVNSVALVDELETPSLPPSVQIPSIIPSQSLLPSRDEVFKEIKDVGEDVAISSLPLFQGDMELHLLSLHASLEEQWDEEEEAEEIEALPKVVPPAYHQYLDVFSKVKAEKLPPHCACYHHIELEGLLPPNLVNDIFADFLDIFFVVYLDDIMVLSSSQEEHVKHVASVLQILRNNNLFAKASKCVFHASSVEYLGYVVSSEGLKIDSSKVQKILNWPQPKNIKALQSFLVFANVYHCFIKNYSKKISALTSLLKKDYPFIFNEEALSQFQILKEAFTTAPLLSHFNPSLPTIVETDAYDYSLGAVLSQVNESGKHPIAFDSRKLLPAELNYELHDRELLGIVWALKHWRAFLLSLSDSFKVLTNHSSLQYFMSSKVLTHRQARWAEFLSKSHFSITYRPGRLATLPDVLSPQDNMYPERGVYFISKNAQNFHQVLKQNEIKESRSFSIKV